jgi:hypothetical protein
MQCYTYLFCNLKVFKMYCNYSSHFWELRFDTYNVLQVLSALFKKINNQSRPTLPLELKGTYLHAYINARTIAPYKTKTELKASTIWLCDICAFPFAPRTLAPLRCLRDLQHWHAVELQVPAVVPGLPHQRSQELTSWPRLLLPNDGNDLFLNLLSNFDPDSDHFKTCFTFKPTSQLPIKNSNKKFSKKEKKK